MKLLVDYLGHNDYIMTVENLEIEINGKTIKINI